MAWNVWDTVLVVGTNITYQGFQRHLVSTEGGTTKPCPKERAWILDWYHWAAKPIPTDTGMEKERKKGGKKVRKSCVLETKGKES